MWLSVYVCNLRKGRNLNEKLVKIKMSFFPTKVKDSLEVYPLISRQGGKEGICVFQV